MCGKYILLLMAKDKRYEGLKALIQSGAIKTIGAIFDYIPKSVVAGDLGVNWSHLSKRLASPENFTYKEAGKLADLIEIDIITISQLIVEQMKTGKR